MVDNSVIEYLKFQLEHGRLVLFTGSGFSRDAKDLDGKGLPTGPDFASELWALCFPGEAQDGLSTLQDLFHTALATHRGELTRLLTRRFSVRDADLPDAYLRWFSLPWRRIYTLNIDDLDEAANRRFDLPRELHSVSGISKRDQPEVSPPRGAVEVVHLNGKVADGPDGVTFSTSQYAERLTAQEPWYARLAGDLLAFPVVYVGSPLDESLLWQHIEFRGGRGGRGAREFRPKSILVVPTLGRARQAMLKDYNIEWLPLKASEFVDDVLSRLSSVSRLGLKQLDREAGSPSVSDVSVLSAAPPTPTPSLFLLGDEPTWNDLKSGRAVPRTIDGPLLDTAKAFAADPSKPALLLVGGTAGSGKTTTLMSLALRLSASGTPVGWVGRDADISPRDIRAFCRSTACKPVLAIDDVDRYGADAAVLIADALATPRLRLVVCTTRASKVEKLLSSPRLASVAVHEEAMPQLTDPDVDNLIDALDRDNKLGRLKGMPRDFQRAAFKERAGRQLLVAMIEATSGQRFEEKVVDEWRELTPEGQFVYALIAVCSALRFTLDREDVLVAVQAQDNSSLLAMDALAKRNVVVIGGDGGVRARHRVIAEALVEELGKQGNALERAICRLAFVAAVKVTPGMSRSAQPRRLLRSVLNHEYLNRMLSLDGARTVYGSVEELVTWDFHFWLQRGSLEVEEGDIRLAENYLNQARALEPDDSYVVTEYSYMAMKKAALSPAAPGAAEAVEHAVAALRDQIESRGDADSYPFHVLGSQGLSWARKAPLGRDEKKTFLRGLLADVEVGLRKHPRRRELQELRDDLKREYLAMEVNGHRA